jgi:hypothetical protein
VPGLESLEALDCRLVFCAGALLLAQCYSASAQTKLDVKYAISAAKIPVGQIMASAEIGDSQYTVSANMTVSGVVRSLASGDASAVTHGSVGNGQLVPATFESRSTFPGDPLYTRVEFEDGRATKVDAPFLDEGDRTPLSDAQLSNVLDPLTALIVKQAEDAAQTCEGRTLPIFDGHLRYDLKLSFKRSDRSNDEPGYAGPVIVCGVVFSLPAGQRPSNPLAKLFFGRSIEATLAPAAATTFMLPYRIVVESMLANLVVQATRLDVAGEPKKDAQ